MGESERERERIERKFKSMRGFKGRFTRICAELKFWRS